MTAFILSLIVISIYLIIQGFIGILGAIDKLSYLTKKHIPMKKYE